MVGFDHGSRCRKQGFKGAAGGRRCGASARTGQGGGPLFLVARTNHTRSSIRVNSYVALVAPVPSLRTHRELLTSFTNRFFFLGFPRGAEGLPWSGQPRAAHAQKGAFCHTWTHTGGQADCIVWRKISHWCRWLEGVGVWGGVIEFVRGLGWQVRKLLSLVSATPDRVGLGKPAVPTGQKRDGSIGGPRGPHTGAAGPQPGDQVKRMFSRPTFLYPRWAGGDWFQAAPQLRASMAPKRVGAALAREIAFLSGSRGLRANHCGPFDTNDRRPPEKDAGPFPCSKTFETGDFPSFWPVKVFVRKKMGRDGANEPCWLTWGGGRGRGKEAGSRRGQGAGRFLAESGPPVSK